MHLPTSTTLLTTALLLLLTPALATNQPRDTTSCPGVIVGTTDCCVGGKIAAPTLSVCKGWPICEGPTTVTPSSSPLSCATVLSFSDSDYSSQASSASSSLDASGTDYRTTYAATAGITASVPSATTTDGNGAGATEGAAVEGRGRLEMGVVGAAVAVGVAALV